MTGLWVVMSSTSTTSVARAGGSFDAVLDRTTVESTGTPTIDLSIVDLRTTDGAELGQAVALHTGTELVASLDLDPGTPLEAILPDGSRRQATVRGHDGLTGVSAVRLDGGAVPGATIEPHGHLVASDHPPMVTEARADGWSHATMAIAAPDAEPGDVVVDDDGKVTALVTSRTDEGATATPIAVVARVAAQLFESGEAAHPWLGVRARDARDGEGVVITHVVPNSPADRHDITAGMIITGVGQTPVVSVGELLTELRAHRPGDKVTIELLVGAITRRVVLDVGDTVDAPG